MKLSKFLFIALAMSFLFVRCEKNTPQEEAQVVTIDTDNDLLDEYECRYFPRKYYMSYTGEPGVPMSTAI